MESPERFGMARTLGAVAKQSWGAGMASPAPHPPGTPRAPVGMTTRSAGDYGLPPWGPAPEPHRFLQPQVILVLDSSPPYGPNREDCSFPHPDKTPRRVSCPPGRPISLVMVIRPPSTIQEGGITTGIKSNSYLRQ